MSEPNMIKARETYNTLCSMLDHKGWHYDRDDEKLKISSGVKGDDLPIEFVMSINPRNEIVTFMSWLPFKVDESKRIDLALATTVANYRLVDGSFDYKLSDGTILFRLTSSYKDSVLGEDLFEYMLMVSAQTVDDYNDKFFMISKGVLDIQKFIEEETV